jgi:tRNA modification GTPase
VLAREDRALVTEIAGTTRDAIRETIQINGIPLHVIDTAGLRDSDDPVEQLGIARTWREIESADVVVQMIDARQGMSAADELIAQKLPERIERIIVANKVDLTESLPQRDEFAGRVYLSLSAQTGAGIDLLHNELLRVAGWTGQGEDVILARERHLVALRLAAEKLACARQGLGQLEFCAEELRLAQGALAEITGAFTADDLLGEIFSRFCIGK